MNRNLWRGCLPVESGALRSTLMWHCLSSRIAARPDECLEAHASDISNVLVTNALKSTHEKRLSRLWIPDAATGMERRSSWLQKRQSGFIEVRIYFGSHTVCVNNFKWLYSKFLRFTVVITRQDVLAVLGQKHFWLAPKLTATKTPDWPGCTLSRGRTSRPVKRLLRHSSGLK